MQGRLRKSMLPYIAVEMFDNSYFTKVLLTVWCARDCSVYKQRSFITFAFKRGTKIMCHPPWYTGIYPRDYLWIGHNLKAYFTLIMRNNNNTFVRNKRRVNEIF